MRGSADKRPHVTLSAGMTLDGRIATVSGDSRISSERDLEEVHRLRSEKDAVMVGIGTVLADDPLLSARRVKGRNPARVVVDSAARTPPGSRMLRVKVADVIVAVSSRAPRSRVEMLERTGARVFRCGVARVDLRALMGWLYRQGMRRILLEGGGELNWSMLAGGLVDEVRVTVTPMLVGGSAAVTLVEGPGIKSVGNAVRLSLSDVSQIGGEVTLTYKVTR